MSVIRDPNDGQPGLSIRSGASILARDMIGQHLAQFGQQILIDRYSGQTTVAEYTEGLAAVMALIIAGGHGSKEEVLRQTETKLREYLERSLSKMKPR